MRNCGAGGPFGSYWLGLVFVLHDAAKRSRQRLPRAREPPIVRRLAVCAPVALVGAGRRIKDDDAVIHVAVGHIELVRRAVDDDVRGCAEVRRVVASFALPRLSDLHHELPAARELQDVRVFLAAATKPDVVFIVDVDAVLELRPIVSSARTSPRRDERAIRIELEHRRRRFPDRSRLVRLQRRRPMRDPHVIARIDRHSGDRADDPSVRQCLRPERIDAEGGNLTRHVGSVLRGWKGARRQKCDGKHIGWRTEDVGASG